MSLFPKGAVLYEIPEQLRKYLQDKAASGIPYLSIIPFAFPVFVMNPSEYSERTHWYDRNPTSIVKYFYVEGQAPHVSAQRWSYAVPKGRKAFVESAITSILRRTAAGAPANVTYAYILYMKGAAPSRFLYAGFIDVNVGVKSSMNMGQNLLMFQGEGIMAFTQDLSSGGTVDYIVDAKITEFDA